MSEKYTTRMAIIAGLLLIISAIALGVWQPPAAQPKSTSFIAHYLYIHWVANIIYILALFISSILIIPVVINATIKLYKIRPNGSIIAGSFFCIGIILQLLAVLESLSRWTHAIPGAMSNNKTGIMLFETLNTNYIAVSFPAYFLLYSAAGVWAFSLWRIHRMLALWLLISIIILFAGIPSLFITNGSFLYFILGSVIAYAMAYIYLGTLILKLENRSY